MIIGYIRMKLTFSNGKLYANVGSFDFFMLKMAVKFRNLLIIKTVNTNTNNFFQFPISFKVMYISLRHT